MKRTASIYPRSIPFGLKKLSILLERTSLAGSLSESLRLMKKQLVFWVLLVQDKSHVSEKSGGWGKVTVI